MALGPGRRRGHRQRQRAAQPEVAQLDEAAQPLLGPVVERPGQGAPRTGALGGSSVDAARTLVDMMASLRAFEAGQKAITTIDSSLDRVNQIAMPR